MWFTNIITVHTMALGLPLLVVLLLVGFVHGRIYEDGQATFRDLNVDGTHRKHPVRHGKISRECQKIVTLRCGDPQLRDMTFPAPSKSLQENNELQLAIIERKKKIVECVLANSEDVVYVGKSQNMTMREFCTPPHFAEIVQAVSRLPPHGCRDILTDDCGELHDKDNHNANLETVRCIQEHKEEISLMCGPFSSCLFAREALCGLVVRKHNFEHYKEEETERDPDGLLTKEARIKAIQNDRNLDDLCTKAHFDVLEPFCAPTVLMDTMEDYEGHKSLFHSEL